VRSESEMSSATLAATTVCSQVREHNVYDTLKDRIRGAAFSARDIVNVTVTDVVRKFSSHIGIWVGEVIGLRQEAYVRHFLLATSENSPTSYCSNTFRDESVLLTYFKHSVTPFARTM